MSAQDPKEFVIPISYGSTELIETGKWSPRKPETQAKTAPCRQSCPAGTDIPLFVHLAGKGKFDEALAAILIENPLPGVCGRTCFHPCEASCNRVHYDGSVSVQLLERFVSSMKLTRPHLPRILPAAGSRRIAIVGSGPAGLSCAYFLGLLGHRPTIFEARDEPGGIMRWGIPPFRLPKPVLKREIRRILALPVEMRTRCRVGQDISFDALDQFDAIFLSPGAETSALLSVEGETLPGVWSGSRFLHSINSGDTPALGSETLVIGGGNTAMDVARSALRLGSKVTIAYRRTKEAMPAIVDEVREAEEEGVQFHFLVQPFAIKRTGNGRLAVLFQCMKSGPPGEGGRLTTVPIDEEFLTMETDTVISAVGESIDGSWIPKSLCRDGLISAAPGSPVFAGGDAADQPRTIVNAIASAKKAAVCMDLFFRGEAAESVLPRIAAGGQGAISMGAYLQLRENGSCPESHGLVSREDINTLYIGKSERAKARKLGKQKRAQTFLEVNLSPDIRSALLSASRCYSCGRCNGCLNCYYFCPEGVITVDTEQCFRTVDYDHCKGCATCVTACPRNAVGMKDVS